MRGRPAVWSLHLVLLVWYCLIVATKSHEEFKSMKSDAPTSKAESRLVPEAVQATEDTMQVRQGDLYSFWPPPSSGPPRRLKAGKRIHRRRFENLGWHWRGAVVDPFRRNGTVTDGPLAFGRIKASYSEVDVGHGEVLDIVRAVEQWDERKQGGGGKGQGDERREEGEEQAEEGKESAWEVLLARKLDLDLVQDADHGEQVLLEVTAQAKEDDDTEEEQGEGSTRHMWVKAQTGVVLYLLLRRRSDGAERRLAASVDHHGMLSLMQDTLSPPPPSAAAPSPTSLRVVSYNIWNTNPPSYLYPQPQQRWGRYVKRMAHLAKVVRESGADVIGLQEVRYDERHGPQGYHSQMQHVIDLLARPPRAEEEEGGKQAPAGRPVYAYQFVYQPAMAFSDHSSLPPGMLHHPRDEEGLAILSRYPIVHTDYLLLPRDLNDGDDGHQRACLHAEVHVPGFGLLDVYSTHWSLSERMREESAAAVLRFMGQGRGRAQVLLGDLNAEPHERSLEMLLGGDVPAAAASSSSSASQGPPVASGLRDAWLDHHDEPPPGSEDEWDRREALTFPCCNPVKRVDYVLYRTQQQQEAEHDDGTGWRCERVGLLGQDATEDTRDNVSEGGGMLDADSPVWASDHRGVFADFVLRAEAGLAGVDSGEGEEEAGVREEL